ncbi:copper amine oxidase N-terminal domain-containing protein [Fenollaria sporofastidiosus]|uniref:copper amine oxidase N-terminal domain-containing protein n=1 Tax=Fenollaria sporofastidiosus TaxID=2811778 RepID=UPI001BFFEC81|nr:copper amine oxidase N-terminal domain-containing protein [Fenollaria sporofastidiosus]
MKVKNAILSTIIATQILSTAALAAPDEAIKEFKKVAPIKQEVKHFQGEVKLFIIKDGEKVRVDQKMTDGLRVVNGRTCVGVRDLVNAIEGAKVEWDGTNHIVDITYAGKTISYPVGKPLMWADGKAVTIDVPAQIDPQISKTFLPIRNIAETLGFKVDWDNKAKEVVLTPGAGTGVTTAQTPTQNSKTKIKLASGEVIDINKPILDKIEYDQGKPFLKSHIYELSDADFIDNGDGTMTFGKGTKLEQNFLKKFKRVDSSPSNPNFKIAGENKGDTRIGTYVIGEGNPMSDKCYKEWSDKKGHELYFSELGAVTGEYKVAKNYFDDSDSFFVSGDNRDEYLLNLFKERKIDKTEVNKFLSTYKYDKNEIYIKRWLLNKNIDFYDGTGIINVTMNGSSRLDLPYIAFYITKDKKVLSDEFSDDYKYKIDVDKVIVYKLLPKYINGKYEYHDALFVIDIPDITLRRLYTVNEKRNGLFHIITPKTVKEIKGI